MYGPADKPKFIFNISSIINNGGILIITDPYVASGLLILKSIMEMRTNIKNNLKFWMKKKNINSQ